MAYKIIEKNCISCGACVEECPVQAITLPGKASIDPDICIDCGACKAICPAEPVAISE